MRTEKVVRGLDERFVFSLLKHNFFHLRQWFKNFDTIAGVWRRQSFLGFWTEECEDVLDFLLEVNHRSMDDESETEGAAASTSYHLGDVNYD